MATIKMLATRTTMKESGDILIYPINAVLIDKRGLRIMRAFGWSEALPRVAAWLDRLLRWLGFVTFLRNRT